MCLYIVNVCIGLTEFDESFTTEVKSPVDSKYDVRIEVRDPPTQMIIWTENQRDKLDLCNTRCFF